MRLLREFPEIREIRDMSECPMPHVSGNDAWTHFTINQDDKIVPNPTNGVVCFKDWGQVLAPSGEPSELFWHEYAHVISEPEYKIDLEHGEKFSRAVDKINRPWLKKSYIPVEWLTEPPTLESWLQYES